MFLCWWRNVANVSTDSTRKTCSAAFGTWWCQCWTVRERSRNVLTVGMGSEFPSLYPQWNMFGKYMERSFLEKHMTVYVWIWDVAKFILENREEKTILKPVESSGLVILVSRSNISLLRSITSNTTALPRFAITAITARQATTYACLPMARLVLERLSPCKVQRPALRTGELVAGHLLFGRRTCTEVFESCPHQVWHKMNTIEYPSTHTASERVKDIQHVGSPWSHVSSTWCRGTILVSTPGLSTSSSRLRKNARHGRSNWKVSCPRDQWTLHQLLHLITSHLWAIFPGGFIGTDWIEAALAPKACVEIYNEATSGCLGAPTHGKTSRNYGCLGGPLHFNGFQMISRCILYTVPWSLRFHKKVLWKQMPVAGNPRSFVGAKWQEAEAAGP